MWLRSCDRSPSHRAVLSLSDAAYRLNSTAQHYCAEQLTGGLVERSLVEALPRAPHGAALRKTLAELERAGLWVPVDGGWSLLVPEGPELVDFGKLNPLRPEPDRKPPRAVSPELTAKRAEAGRKGATRRWQAMAPDSKQDGKTYGKTVATETANPMAPDGNFAADLPLPEPVPEPNLNSPPPSEDLEESARDEANEPEPRGGGGEVLCSEEPTECPPSLLELMQACGDVRGLAEFTGASEADVLECLKRFAAHWLGGKGKGQMRPLWGAKARQWVLDKHHEHLLVGLAAQAPPPSASRPADPGLPPGWRRHPGGLDGMWLDEDGQVRTRLPGVSPRPPAATTPNVRAAYAEAIGVAPARQVRS